MLSDSISRLLRKGAREANSLSLSLKRQAHEQFLPGYERLPSCASSFNEVANYMCAFGGIELARLFSKSQRFLCQEGRNLAPLRLLRLHRA
eukprot:3531363-Alexandrium_andersonii.AAC.1